jgi:hypothetical protein
MTVQRCLHAMPIDGIFGPVTGSHVRNFQAFHHLDVDGIVGPQTWAVLEREFNLPPYPPPLPAVPDTPMIDAICDLAMSSPIATYQWRDRGQMPPGYTQGMALAFSTVLRKFLAGDGPALEMAKANTQDDETDVLAWYANEIGELNIETDKAGTDVLRTLFVVLMGLGPRESSGRHCEGRDMSAENVESDTAEAGLFQTSWNINTCSDQIQTIVDQYSGGTPLCSYTSGTTA